MALATSAGSPIRPIGCIRSISARYSAPPGSSGSRLTALGSDRSGSNGVDSDPPVGPLDRQVLGQAGSNELGGPVGRLPLLPGQSGYRGEADDGPATGRQHRLDRELAREKHATPIDGHHFVPASGGHLHRITERDDAGVGDQHIEPSEAVGRCPDHPPRVVLNRDVADNRLDLRPGMPQFIGKRQQWLALNIGRDQPRALAREEHGGRPTNAERRPGDHSGLPEEASWSLGHSLLAECGRGLQSPQNLAVGLDCAPQEPQRSPNAFSPPLFALGFTTPSFHCWSTVSVL